MNTSSSTTSTATTVRIHLADGSVESFAQHDKAKARRIWESLEPNRIFAQQRIVIGGTHSKSVFVCSEILRIDFDQQNCGCWEFPQGYSDVVEISEAHFRKHAHLDQPELMANREHPMLVRGASLSDSMSQYLEDQIAATKNIDVKLNSSVIGVEGADRCEKITIQDNKTRATETVPASAGHSRRRSSGRHWHY
jgi:hypothetical protein